MINTRKILVYDDDCGVCSAITAVIQKFNLNYTIVGASISENLLIEYQIDRKIADETIILIYENGSYSIESAAFFDIISDILKFSACERKFLFSEKIIKFFNPLYRYIANRRAKISVLLGLNSCKINGK